MSKSWKTLIAAVVVAGGASSIAIADGYEYDPVGTAFAPAPVYRWSGVYVGGHLGGIFDATSDWKFDSTAPLTTSRDPDDEVVGGVHAGYNAQFNNIVIGVEGDATFLNADGRSDCPDPVSFCEVEVDRLYSLRGRLGFTVGAALVYATGGWAWAKVDARADLQPVAGNLFTGDASLDGAVYGGGFEWMFGSNISVGAEALRYDFDTDRVDPFVNAAGVNDPFNIDLDATVVRARLSLKFDHRQPAAPPLK